MPTPRLPLTDEPKPITVADIIAAIEPYKDCAIDGGIVAFNIPVTGQYYRNAFGGIPTSYGLVVSTAHLLDQREALVKIKQLIGDKG